MFFFLLFFDRLIETVRLVSLPVLEGLASLVVENRIQPMYLTSLRTIGLCRLAMFAIDAERKVCPIKIIIIGVEPLDTFYKAIGYKNVLQTTIASLTIDHG